MTSDSRDLNKAIADNTADLVVNWKATAQWARYRSLMEAISLGDDIATSHSLVLGLLTYSKEPDIARSFMAFAVSPKGQNIFANYGFGRAQYAEKSN